MVAQRAPVRSGGLRHAHRQRPLARARQLLSRIGDPHRRGDGRSHRYPRWRVRARTPGHGRPGSQTRPRFPHRWGQGSRIRGGADPTKGDGPRSRHWKCSMNGRQEKTAMRQTRKAHRARTVLVAGGAGFLGSHLCEVLLRNGWRVICVDNFLTGRMENIISIMDRPGFRLIEQDICRPLDLGEAVDDIFNLACAASPPSYQADPIHPTRTCVIGTLNLLELAVRNDARLLQASTSEVYGDPEQHPQREDYVGHVNCTGPRACYDEGKRTAETLCFDYLRAGKADVRVARIFNTYGPRMDPDDGRIVSNLIMQALEKRPLTIFGDGQQTRSFCYVSDLVEGLLRLMDIEPNPR